MPPDDRWVRSMSLTQKSRRIVDEVVTARGGIADWLFKGLDDELQAFGAASERLVSRISGRAPSRLTEQ